jgi:heme A synthase
MKAYRVLASLVALAVVVQAALVAYGIAGLSHWIYDERNTATRATFEGDSGVDYGGKAGFDMHGELGALWLPLLALAFLVVAFLTRRSVARGLRWAAIVVGLMALQVGLGFATLAVPALALVHAVNALALFSTAAWAATRVAPGHARSIGSGRQPPAVELDSARMREASV